MITIKGFGKAKTLLNREIFSDFSTLLAGEGEKSEKPHPEQVVRQIIAEVRDKGDKALFSYTRELDKVELTSLEVTRNEISAAYEKVDEKLVSALKLAANRINKFHSDCKQRLDSGFLSNGLGRKVHPINRVGIYIPGGTAAYPSTVLMAAIPAQVAGVKDIIITTPPQEDGTIPPPTLVAADIARVNRLFKIGGAQAIAALAFGTQSVPKVDKICGPGNIFVMMAKKMVFGAVDVDGLQGPSEVIIVADDTADASFCAADLIAQAEHDPLASAILVTTSSRIAADVDNEINSQLARLKRQTIASEAINSRGMIVLVDNLKEAIELVNIHAPEHLSLMINNAETYLDRIHNAGCIFIGNNTPVALGDYIAGPSHVLPTGGSARFSSPLGIETFLKVINIVSLDIADNKEIGQAAITIASAEGLTGHAQAIKTRFQKNEEEPK